PRRQARHEGRAPQGIPRRASGGQGRRSRAGADLLRELLGHALRGRDLRRVPDDLPHRPARPLARPPRDARRHLHGRRPDRPDRGLVARALGRPLLRGAGAVIRRLLFVVVAALALGPSASAGAARGRDWLLLASDRDGTQRAYSMRRDGSRLSPVVPSDLALVPEGTTRDGRLVAYDGPQEAIYVSRADGTGLRRLVRSGDVEGFSPDGKLLAFSGPIDSVIRVVGTNGRG